MMPETFFEKWRGRIKGAWDVLTGRGAVFYYQDHLFMRPDEIAAAVERMGPTPWETPAAGKTEKR